MSGTLLKLAEQYLQCSYRGVPFVVVGSGGQAGRKQAEHDYPYRDGVWIEDLGKRARVYYVRGFVSGPTALVQRDLLVNAAEASGSGLLVHPSIGAIRASCTSFAWSEPDGIMGRVDVVFEFVEQKNYLTTLVHLALDAAISAAALVVRSASSSAYLTATTSALAIGSPAIVAARSVAVLWGKRASNAVRSPRVMAATIATLPGNNGRYAAGNSALVDASATVSSVLTDLALFRSTLDEKLSTLSTLTTADSLASAVQDITESLRSSINDPGAQLAVLQPLIAVPVDAIDSTAPIGAAITTAKTETARLCSMAALASFAQACASWEPTSAQEAETLRLTVATLLDDAATQAADAGFDDIWQAIRTLRSQVTQDLSQRASQLPDQITVARNQPLPALVLAQQLYADATRAPDLIRHADPVHPALMPTQFQALSF